MADLLIKLQPDLRSYGQLFILPNCKKFIGIASQNLCWIDEHHNILFRFDVADRQFHSIPQAWRGLINNINDVKVIVIVVI